MLELALEERHVEFLWITGRDIGAGFKDPDPIPKSEGLTRY